MLDLSFDLAKSLPDGAILRRDGTFQYYAPISLFTKADAPEGQRRRFGGIATTEEKDQEGEVILQRGLDWSHFLARGYFNDNHSKKTGGIVGYPTGVQFYRKGESLPNGKKAEHNLHWTEGYLLKGVPGADDIWAVGNALGEAGDARRLGQSIEGRIVLRDGPDQKTIARAAVYHTAITHVPVNAGTSLGFLAKALRDAESGALDFDPDWAHESRIDDDNGVARALTMTTGPAAALPAGTNPSAMGPVSGAGAGRILARQSLEHDAKKTTYGGLPLGGQFDLIQSRYPGFSLAACGQILGTIQALAGRTREMEAR